MTAVPAILSIVTFLPLLGALAILIARLTSKSQDAAAPAARWIALGTTLAVLAVAGSVQRTENGWFTPRRL